MERATGQPVAAAFEGGPASVPGCFEQAAGRHGGRLAVKSSRHAWSYAELNRNANRLAHAVLAAAGPDCVPVALLFEHDAPAIAAILGVLKAGKFYASLDPAHPLPRNAAALADLQAPLLLCDRANLPAALELAGGRCRLLVYEAVDASAATENPRRRDAPAMPLGIFHTSGSTGRPKGVLWNQNLSLHRVRADLRDIAVTPADRHTLLTSLTFPASSSDINLALLNGASLHLYDVRKFGATYLADWLRQEDITCLRAPLALFRAFLDSLAEADGFPEVRMIGLGGDVLFRKDVESARRHFPAGCRIIHRYTISEAGMVASLVIDAGTVLDGPVVPVGHPVAEKRVILLDEEGRGAGPGQPGEIAVCSRHLAAGYWGQPDLTRQRFVPDPDEPGSVTFLTGDLGRWRPDGSLELLGRKDFRLKIRGYRIEPAAVEAALRAVDGVREAAVVARPDAAGEPCLVAYVVAGAAPAPDARRLRGRLAETLPDYMLPAAFVFIEALPLTRNGKLDRQRLPGAAPARSEPGRAVEAPRTPTEQALAEIFADVLRLDQVGLRDNFFDLGGHSLLAARAIARVNDRFGIGLPLRDFYDAPTVAGLAEAIGGGGRPAPAAEISAEEERRLQEAIRLLGLF